MRHPWMRGAAEVILPDDNDEGGPIYPTYIQGSQVQSTSSTYAGRNFASDIPSPARIQLSAEELVEREVNNKFIAELVYYLMVKMEPTDRCLRMPGDIFDPKRLEQEEGTDGQ